MTKLLPALLLLSACSATQKPQCSEMALAQIESLYVAEVLTSCSGYKTPEECPRYEEIRGRYEQKRNEWVKCR